MIKLYMSRDTSLYDAAKRGDENEVQRLLQAGIDANQEVDGEPALIAAAQQGDLGIVRLLVERGARVDATDDYFGTALTEMGRGGNDDVVSFLCWRGADVDHTHKYGATALHVFSVHGQRNRIKIVVAFGASLDVLDDNNESPLTYGIEFKCVECIRVLLALNANATKVKLETVANDEIRQLLVAHSKKTEKERLELREATLNQIRSEVAVRLMRHAQPEIIGICLALSSLNLPPYVLLWIIDWLPNYDRLSPRHKIQLIESIRNSVSKLKY